MAISIVIKEVELMERVSSTLIFSNSGLRGRRTIMLQQVLIYNQKHISMIDFLFLFSLIALLKFLFLRVFSETSRNLHNMIFCSTLSLI